MSVSVRTRGSRHSPKRLGGAVVIKLATKLSCMEGHEQAFQLGVQDMSWYPGEDNYLRERSILPEFSVVLKDLLGQIAGFFL